MPGVYTRASLVRFIAVDYENIKKMRTFAPLKDSAMFG